MHWWLLNHELADVRTPVRQQQQPIAQRIAIIVDLLISSGIAKQELVAEPIVDRIKIQ